MKKQFFRHDPYVSVLLLALVFFAAQFVASILLTLYPALRNWTEAQGIAWLQESVSAQFMYILLAETIIVLTILKILKWINVRYRHIGLVKPQLRDVGYALIAYGLYFLASLLIRIIARPLLTGIDFDQEQQIGFETAYSTGELLMTFASLVILPPIAEEILFRGFLFTSLRAKYKYRTSVIVTSALFGLAHLQFGSEAPLLWVAAIDTFVLSWFLCNLREQTGSLWPPMLLHAIKNAVAFVLLFGPRFI